MLLWADQSGEVCCLIWPIRLFVITQERLATWACSGNNSAKLIADELAVNLTYLNKVKKNFFCRKTNSYLIELNEKYIHAVLCQFCSLLSIKSVKSLFHLSIFVFVSTYFSRLCLTWRALVFWTLGQACLTPRYSPTHWATSRWTRTPQRGRSMSASSSHPSR